jgi:hypothetical protein
MLPGQDWVLMIIVFVHEHARDADCVIIGHDLIAQIGGPGFFWVVLPARAQRRFVG